MLLPLRNEYQVGIHHKLLLVLMFRGGQGRIASYADRYQPHRSASSIASLVCRLQKGKSQARWGLPGIYTILYGELVSFQRRSAMDRTPCHAFPRDLVWWCKPKYRWLPLSTPPSPHQPPPITWTQNKHILARPTAYHSPP